MTHAGSPDKNGMRKVFTKDQYPATKRRVH